MLIFKSSSEEAYTLIFVYYYRLKQVESILREIGLPEFSLPYQVRIDDCYDLLNEIDKAIKVQPIAVDEINAKVSTLKVELTPCLMRLRISLEKCNLPNRQLCMQIAIATTKKKSTNNCVNLNIHRTW